MVKNLLASAGDARDVGSVPGPGRSLGDGNGYLLQYSCLENPMDRGAWRVTVHGVAKSNMTPQLSLFTYIYSILTIFKWCTLHPVALSTFIMECNHHPEKAMATHSSTLAWNIPWTEEPGRLQSMGSLGVRYD